MASLIRPTYSDRRTGKKKRLRKWYGKFTDAAGVRQRVPLSTNKQAAQTTLADLLRKVERDRAGITDPFEAHRTRPLADHLADWAAALRAGGSSAKHVRQTVACARKVIDGCGFVFTADLSGSAVQTFVASLRQSTEAPELPAGQEWFTRREVADLLGVSPWAVTKVVARHRLPATGNGKARRYPRATVADLIARHARGRNTGTANLYLAAVKQLCRWLVTDRRMPDNPLGHLKAGDANADRRRLRRTLSADELRAVIAAARSSPRTVRGLTGPDRAALYAVACASGFRAGELAILTPEDFNLAGDVPTVQLDPGESKNGQEAVQPLPPDMAAELRS